MGLLNKFPSFNFIYKNAAATFVRFPFTILSAVLGAVVGIMLVESDRQSQEYVLQKLGMVAALGLPLFTALAFYAGKKLWDKKTCNRTAEQQRGQQTEYGVEGHGDHAGNDRFHSRIVTSHGNRKSEHQGY